MGDFKWLGYDSENDTMICSVCKKAGQKNSLSVGSRNFQKSSLSRHDVSQMHHAALATVKAATSLRKGLQVQSTSKLSDSNDPLVPQLRTVNFIVKHNLPVIIRGSN